MNAQLKPVPLAITRPRYLRYDLVRQNDRDGWLLANADIISARYALLADEMDIARDALTLSSDSIISFALSQWDIERQHHEELKDDGKFDDFTLQGDDE